MGEESFPGELSWAGYCSQRLELRGVELSGLGTCAAPKGGGMETGHGTCLRLIEPQAVSLE